MLQVRHLSKSYTSGNQVYPVLKDVSLRVEKGEFVAVMGDCAIIGLNRKNLTKSGFLRHSPISLTRKRETQSLPD